MNFLRVVIQIIFFIVAFVSNAQHKLTVDHIKPYTNYFTVSNDFNFSENIQPILQKEAQNSQFIGLAEVHQSEQLSFFTTAFLKVLKKEGFNNFALEIGAHSTKILEELSQEPTKTSANLKALNTKYGKNKFPFIPFIFIDKKADALFIEEAAKLDFNLWGIDREYEFSYLMHLDKLYEKSTKTPVITKAYQKARKVMNKIAFKDKVSGEAKFCWLLHEQTLQSFFETLSYDATLQHYIKELQNSWELYCRFMQKRNGSSARAAYMRSKFDSLYTIAQTKEKLPKVLVKLGGVHLTHGISQYNRYDVGKHLHEKAKTNQTNFLAIRHVYRYRNGKDQIAKKGWDRTRFLMQLGKKEEWTLIDLRPIKKLVEMQQLQVDKGTAWELQNYDWFLISPNDSKGNINR